MYSLLHHNTFGIDQSCDVFYEPTSEEEVMDLLPELRERPFLVIGGGSNLLLTQDFNGVVVHPAIMGISAFEDEEEVMLRCGAGENWDSVVEYAVTKGYYGMENLSLIPGEVGASAVQNIGAYGQDISQTFVSAEVYDSTTGEFKTMPKDDFKFSYRKSIMNTTEKNRYFVISISLKLTTGKMERPFYNSIEKYILDHDETVFTPTNIRKIVSTIRAEKLPDPKEVASAGSFFKNIYISEEEAPAVEQRGIPVHRGKDGVKINSGWLIEQAGLAGQLYFGVRVSEKAALVLINESAKSFGDLAAVRDFIINTVFNKFGYRLEQEPIELVDNNKKIADLLKG
jgi:UDP-N-acetylmuramate dehydrogenase